MVNVYCAIQGCDQNLSAVVDESCDATSHNLSSLSELIGRMSVQFGVVISNFTDLHLVISHSLIVETCLSL